MQEEIIKEIVSNKELCESPLLLSWIEQSEKNRNAYVRYKNSYALLQSGKSMTEHEIIKNLESIKNSRKLIKKSLKTFLLNMQQLLFLLFLEVIFTI